MTESQIHLVMEYCVLGDLSVYIRKKGVLNGQQTLQNPLLNGWGGLHERIVADFLGQIGIFVVGMLIIK